MKKSMGIGALESTGSSPRAPLLIGEKYWKLNVQMQ